MIIMDNMMLYMELIMLVLVSLILIIFAMVSVACFKYIHLRKGPNKVGFIGILQPFSDDIKLVFAKNMLILFMYYIMYILYLYFLYLLYFLIMWMLIPYMGGLLFLIRNSFFSS